VSVPAGDGGGSQRAWWRRLAVAAALLASAGCAAPRGPRPPAAPQKPALAWVAYPEAEVAGVKDAHAYQGRPLCQRCHQGQTPALRLGAIALCKECHPQRHGNHPVDVVHGQPARDLPYLEGGRVACHTCHDPHDVKAQPKGLRFKFNDLCLRCHQQH
jgi:predicted CXXCH cytochrome family protein